MVNCLDIRLRYAQRKRNVMYCKFCGAPLDDGKTFCEHCGRETAERHAIVVTPGRVALAVGIAVVLLAVLVALIAGGLSGSSDPAGTDPTVASDVTEAATEATEEPTIPADTGLEDVTNKGSYTASDAAVLAAGDTVVATMGDVSLTNAQLQVYYWLQVQEFLNSEYGYYASYLGLDYTKPMDTQPCPLDEGLTWQQYFLKGALNAWFNYQVMACEADATEFVMPEEFQEYLDTIPQSITDGAESAGFETREEYIAYMVGSGASEADYLHFWEVYYRGYAYFSAQYELLVPTDEEAEAYFEEHLEDYTANGVDRESKTVDVRHVLILPQGATLETIRSETFSDEAWEYAREQAQALLDKWAAEDGTEEGFGELANTNSVDPGSNTSGGLYTDVAQGDMVESFDAWCFDAARQAGDYGLVKSELGYHLMYFSGSKALWLEYAKGDLASERATQMLKDAAEKYTQQIDYAAIVLGNAGLFNQ